MATIHLYLVRHGQTELNAAGRLQGIYDSDLTKQGVRSAQRLARMLADVHFGAAYTSDLGRAQQTTRIITALHPELKKPTIDVGLREFNFGGLEGTKNAWVVQQVRRQLGIGTFVKLILSKERFATLLWVFNSLDQTRTAETLVGVTDRISRTLRRISLYESRQADHDQNILIVSHGLVLSAFLYQLSPGELPTRLLKNTSVSRVDYTDHQFDLIDINVTPKKRA
ncbi:histidine phosphatase family protein [Lactiplantibacillus mudanjiangensis]|uniref:Phosphoglycerate mutase [Lactobacillus plantarum JDM1] n=1 Tax=Lactiplantibacillus mudanjiangensis TaxID=1296538 RepID=A0A660DYX5_9LACO|nr:histidine phosphatase family protein [Lactiplantibacillus mudanjiangensis]VDG18820.1 phosphoglycerate mutase [Lactobacillus plantarum JDM1] [Lactiplantibacillus mudanjiangensis]VDG25092.1 phosphoglycerate mutase [Lactobacillus plantarum JDM1] [Lactiplantibacillus mudanjiangensis]VDG29004.1 phosphoglycerate mutase [Lactobacillus plantarum JDM1] [Lactiplantibacillus mudanjiangensis]VDG32918.1 phosphoglycerate mutase [Lactobacillus plantarum JDM1] [Lactiplantibacillus mudanjiangensis]